MGRPILISDADLDFFDNYLFIIMEADDQALSIVDSIA